MTTPARHLVNNATPIHFILIVEANTPGQGRVRASPLAWGVVPRHADELAKREVTNRNARRACVAEVSRADWKAVLDGRGDELQLRPRLDEAEANGTAWTIKRIAAAYAPDAERGHNPERFGDDR